jgi:acylphosphatase
MARIGRHVCAAGRVQGVFFRAWTAEQARALGISGWVRNCPDGSVEAHLAGDEPAVARMVERLRIGPPQAIVDRLDVEEVSPEPGDRFEIHH